MAEKNKEIEIQFVPPKVNPPRTLQEAYELGIIAGKMIKEGICPLSVEGMAEAYEATLENENE